MTVQKDVTKNIYVGNGSTRTYPFTFECPAEHPEYIKVYLIQEDGTAQVTVDYLLDMDARQITYPSSGAALPDGKKLVIMRELPLQQQMNLVNNGPYFAEDIEQAFDENVMAMQQIAEKLNRTITMSVDVDGSAFINEVPFEAGKSFRIADDGKSIVLTEDPARVLPLAQGVYAQAQAQAQSAYASAVAAAQSEDSAAASASEAGNSAQSASTSAASAAESAELTSGYKQEALAAKADATASATNAKTSETNAKTSADSAGASKEAAQSAATTASNFASAARNSAYEAQTYMDNAKNYSENVNVFVPSVSSAGVLSWTNKAGLPNPASVNIKGAKGDKGDTGAQGIQGIQGVKGDKGDRGAQGIQGVKGDKGDKGDTGAQGIQGVKGDKGATGAPGAAATIRIGNVVTGAPGTNVVVTNSGTSSAAVLNFQIPRGTPGADGGVTVDEVLNATSLNPVANKTVYAALQEKVTAEEITNTYAKKSDVSALLSIKLGITATAYAATRDGAGNNIVDTYAKKTDISGIVKSVNGKEPDAGGNVNVEEYTHPNSGVTAGTYRSVTVNAQGHVTAGSNTTLAIADGGTGANNASDACANIGALPTAGGIMTGAIKWDNNELLGNSSGSLTWAGKVVERINTIGKNYIRFESGLQICWGNTEITGNNNATSTVTLPIAFKNTNYSVTGTGSFGNLVSDISFGLVTIPTITTSNFTCKKLFGEKSTFRWVAIGYWK